MPENNNNSNYQNRVSTSGITLFDKNGMMMRLSYLDDSLCKHMGTPKVHADRLVMKNEFYLSRIIFTDAKKRYVSNSVLQEGQLLNGGKPDIKGFDFKNP